MIDELSILKRSTEGELKSIREQSGLYLEDSPGRSEVLKQIAQLEAKLKKLEGISSQADELLSKHGVTSIKALDDLKRAHENTIRSQPQKMWDLLVTVRGAGKYGAKSHTDLLPSDICKLPEYAAEEDKARAKIETALKAVGPVGDDLRAIHKLADGANAI
jgi:hypothetical protein